MSKKQENQIRVQVVGKRIVVTFDCIDEGRAEQAAAGIAAQLRTGVLHVTLSDPAVPVIEEPVE